MVLKVLVDVVIEVFVPFGLQNVLVHAHLVVDENFVFNVRLQFVVNNVYFYCDGPSFIREFQRI